MDEPRSKATKVAFPLSVPPRKILYFVLTLILATLVYFLLPPDCPEPARRTAAIFVVAALFWGLEVIPLYATSLLVVLLEIFLLARPGGVMDMDRSGYRVFLAPFASPIIMLFFGGFVIAEAFRKYQLDRWIATHLLRRFGTQPYMIMIGFMLTTALLSMWISNTATTALMLAMIGPLLLDLKQSDPYRKGLVLAIAFAANIGGTVTPIGTPPNAIAIGFLATKGIEIHFLTWMMLTLPLGLLLIFVNSLILYPAFRPQRKTLSFHIESPKEFSAQGKFVILVGLTTIFLWLTSGWHRMPEALVALVSVGLLAAFGVFNQEDLKHINWDILVLMWGGLALGEGMQISGLARWIVDLPFFSAQGGFTLIVIFCVTAVLLSTFMSNTATVNLLLPIAISIPGESPVVLAAIIALASSFDIALPISTPPMAIAYGTRVLKVSDMLKVGVIFTLIANILLLINFKLIVVKVLGAIG